MNDDLILCCDACGSTGPPRPYAPWPHHCDQPMRPAPGQRKRTGMTEYRTGASKSPADHVRDVVNGGPGTITTRPSFWGRDDAGRWHVLRLARPTGFGPVTRCGRFLPDDALVIQNQPADECTACATERSTANLAANELATMRATLQERRPA